MYLQPRCCFMTKPRQLPTSLQLRSDCGFALISALRTASAALMSSLFPFCFSLTAACFASTPALFWLTCMPGGPDFSKILQRVCTSC